MTSLSVEINCSIEKVWDFISDINSHTNWMQDAVSIERLNEKDNEVGAKYLCKTAVGPLKTDDIMEVIRYEKPDLIEIYHQGAVKGPGKFELIKLSNSKTEFIWTEELTLPLYMGGNFGKFFAMKLLHQIWRKNLKALKNQVENFN